MATGNVATREACQRRLYATRSLRAMQQLATARDDNLRTPQGAVVPAVEATFAYNRAGDSAALRDAGRLLHSSRGKQYHPRQPRCPHSHQQQRPAPNLLLLKDNRRH
jgi:hypothetical protein